MQPVKDIDAKTLAELEQLGFKRTEEPGSPQRVRFDKFGCAVVFERNAAGQYEIVLGPGYLIAGEISRLWDAGFQKFLLTRAGRRPATTEHLKALHRFEDELRTVLHLSNLYNESLGTTCDVTAYDRVQGRLQ